ncbi:hypothetical protein [Rhizobium terrae]|uniref:hypothetical protein n=1 Tax=Rhizobium terrae TaxID=2171756 RepID=UPI000E3DF4CC|nr:hypothetical protein [Rhizobium terrae]
MLVLRIVALWFVLQFSYQAWLLGGHNIQKPIEDLFSRPVLSKMAQVEVPVSVIIALQKTATQRASDASTSPGLVSSASATSGPAFRRAEDSYFRRRADRLADRLADGKSAAAQSQVFAVKTGGEFLSALAVASQVGPIANIVIYGHSGPDGLYMMEDAGFYVDVNAERRMAGVPPKQKSFATARHGETGARDIVGLKEMINAGEVKFTPDAIIVLAGCNAAGEINFNGTSIAAKLSEATQRRVVASIGKTLSWSSFGGSDYGEYSLRNWVELDRDGAASFREEKGLDPLQILNFSRDS